MAGRHTIILMQPSQNRASRTFMDYNSINHALDGICGLYERKIRDINPMVPNITYDITDLYNFIDGLADISALVYDNSIQAFLPQTCVTCGHGCQRYCTCLILVSQFLEISTCFFRQNNTPLLQHYHKNGSSAELALSSSVLPHGLLPEWQLITAREKP
ncbi:hypothetical protein GUJ93_ZPchr0002g23369 [Zizania palustris]|uniref:Enhancer of rudimentary homolog n=1 Tax=Zizania palustris TaxID=103762 RepID=A0A8J5SC45_ZIZPA|nr:hypothetical protein GUJ93_ZPchr0002g23369 [Zizania palustris]